MNLTCWKCFTCGEEFFANSAEKHIGCPKCDEFEISEDTESIYQMVEQAAMDYSAPEPEFSLDENVLSDITEPKIEFYGTCSVCEIPLPEEYSGLKFCADCADDTWKILMSGNKGEEGLPN